jgi:hypothetical protein
MQDHRAISVSLAMRNAGQLRAPTGTQIGGSAPLRCHRGTPSKLVMRVRLPSPAPVSPAQSDV